MLDDLCDPPFVAITEGVVLNVGVRAGDGDVLLTAGGIRLDVGDRLRAADVDVRPRVRVCAWPDRRAGASRRRSV